MKFSRIIGAVLALGLALPAYAFEGAPQTSKAEQPYLPYSAIASTSSTPIPIFSLPLGSAPGPSDILVGGQSGIAKKFTVGSLASALNIPGVGGQVWTGNQNFTGATITVPTTSVTDSTNNAASTSFVQILLAAKNSAIAVEAATTGALPNSPTYNNQSAGVGATLTAGLSGSLVIDGYTVLTGDRILVKNQSSAFQNGIYIVTATGGSVAPYVLTRSPDFNSTTNINNSDAVPVINGTTNGLTAWVETAVVSTVGTSSISFSQPRPPAAAASSLGGIKSTSSVSHQWVAYCDTTGTCTQSQPAFTDISGSLACSQRPALTGDVTASAGSCATTIANNAVTNAKLAQAAANTVRGNFTGSTANENDNTVPDCHGANQFLTFTAGNGATALGCASASGGTGGVGNVSTTGSPSSGNLTKFSGSNTVTNGDLSGDCTTSGTLVVGCINTINQTNFAGGDVPLGFSLTKRGRIVSPNTGSWNAALVETLSVFFDPLIGKYKMTYAGYTGTAGNPSTATVGSLGYATASSPEGPWAQFASNPFFSLSGTDCNSALSLSGPVVRYESGTYYLFYIGFPNTGYESGASTMCVATSTDFSTWTRHGAIISTQAATWRSAKIFHPSIVKRGSTYYMFFNASNGTIEQIGYATATSLLGPWTVDDTNILLSTGAGGSWESQIVGDPSVYRIGDTWYMAYAGFNGTIGQDGVAFTDDAHFPLGPSGGAWTKYASNPILTVGSSGQYDAFLANRPSIWITGNKLYHFYSADDNAGIRGIGLAVDNSLSGAVDQLGQVVVSGSSTSSISFPYIPPNYTSLRLQFTGRSLGATVNDVLVFQANGDTGSNYTWTLLFSNGTPGGVATNTQTNGWLCGLPGATGFTNFPSACTADFLSYANASFYKQVNSMGGNPTSSSAVQLTQVSNWWKNTAAISSLNLFIGSGSNFVAGTTATLYGIK